MKSNKYLEWLDNLAFCLGSSIMVAILFSILLFKWYAPIPIAIMLALVGYGKYNLKQPEEVYYVKSYLGSYAYNKETNQELGFRPFYFDYLKYIDVKRLWSN